MSSQSDVASQTCTPSIGSTNFQGLLRHEIPLDTALTRKAEILSAALLPIAKPLSYLELEQCTLSKYSKHYELSSQIARAFAVSISAWEQRPLKYSELFLSILNVVSTSAVLSADVSLF